MNANLAIVACVSFAVVVVTAVLLVREPEAKTGTTPSASRKELDDVRGRIASVEESQASILTQLEAVGRKLDELATRSKNAAEGGSIGTGGKDDDAGSGAGHTDDSATLAKAEDDAKDAADAAREALADLHLTQEGQNYLRMST